MPQSRKRAGHHTYPKKSDVPATQRTTGHTLWALLFAVFGLLMAFFAAGLNYIALAIGALAGAAIGYFVGRKMEEDSRNA